MASSIAVTISQAPKTDEWRDKKHWNTSWHQKLEVSLKEVRSDFGVKSWESGWCTAKRPNHPWLALR